MNIEIFIGFLGLLITMYAIAPEVVKARVHAFINPLLFKIAIPLYIVVSLCVLYFEHYYLDDVLMCEVLFWAKYLSYCGIFLLIWFIYTSLRDRKLGKSNIERFYKFLKVLLSKQQFSILIDILHGSLKYILPLYNVQAKPEKCKKLKNTIMVGGKVIPFPVFPSDSFETEISKKIFRDVIFNESFIRANIHYGKNFSIDFISGCRKNKIHISDYSDLFLYELLKNKDSFLYQELKETLTVYSPSNDEFDRFPFLHVLFEDIKYFNEQGFYRGIGEYVIEFVDRNIDSNNERYSRSTKYYWDQRERDGKYKCPVYMGLSYFTYMVNKAIRENIQSHMWLLYVHYWVKAICKKMVYYEDEWQGGGEFPTIYCYLLYELLGIHGNWVKHIYEVSSEEQHGSSFQQDDKSIDISEERELILEWILKDMLYCADSIAQCEAIPYDKRVYLLKTFMGVNIGIKSNFSQYGKACIAKATNLNKVISIYIDEFEKRIRNKNYSKAFNEDLKNACQDALESMDTIPLDSNIVRFWKGWLSGLQ